MAKTRVHDLAKEYGMTSKEMLGYLKDMKIPARSASSTLEDAYVSIVRKKLKPVLEARAAEIEAQRQAEAEAKARAAAEARAKAEQERLAAEERRRKEREEAEARAKAERERQEAERKAAEEAERKAAEEAERNRVRDNAPKSTPSFASLLEQIARQDELLKQQETEQAQRKAEEERQRKSSNNSNNRRERAPRDSAPSRGRRSSSEPRVSAEAIAAAQPAPDANAGRGRGRKGRGQRGESEDRYSRMAREAEEYNRERVLADARAAVREANRESTGRRRKRKERRQQQAEAAAEQQRIEQAIANDQDLSQLDTVKVPQGSTVAELAELLVAEGRVVVLDGRKPHQLPERRGRILPRGVLQGGGEGVALADVVD